jgi:tRNA threonylcarbamoyladenosine biosynthesis protein TsaB
VLAGEKIGGLDFMVAVRGPGSFTGIRLSLAVAKGFVLAAGVPARGIDRFLAAYVSHGGKGRCLVAFSAGGDDAYAAEFSGQGYAMSAPWLAKLAELKAPAGAELLLDPGIIPEKVLMHVEERFDRAAFAQGPLEALYVKPHYAKARK